MLILLRQKFLRRSLLALLVLLIASLTAARAAEKDAFLEAQDAFRKGNAARLAVVAPKLKGHSLWPYIEYYQLRMRVDVLGQVDVDDFMSRYGNDYLGEAMRVDWMRNLGRKGRWPEVESEFAKLRQPDGESKCLALTARWRRSDSSQKEEARQLWRGLPELDAACEQFYRLMFDQRVLPEAEIWWRARQQFEQARYRLARRTLDYLPKAHRVEAHAWSALNNKPDAFLAGFASTKPLSPANGELVVLAIQRLAVLKPRDAARQLSRLSPLLALPERNFLWGQVASQAAYNHLPEALEWFALVAPVFLSDEQRRWTVRAALRAADWPRVSEFIDAMPQALAAETAWIYWRGRAERAAGREDEAKVWFERVAGRPYFYGILAAEELGRRIKPPPLAPAATLVEMEAVAGIGSIRRALAFFRLDQRTEGSQEWAWALNGMSDRELLAAAELARREHVYDRAINAAEKTQQEHDYSLRYLTPYDDKVRPAAQRATLDDAWVYALMRQESRFVAAARSPSGAQGLMQLMPATARWMASRLRLKNFQHSQASDVDINILLGTSYLRLVYENLDRHPMLASAAYNAGPKRAHRWRDPVRPLEGAIYAETIPFPETRDYVKKVLANAVFYTVLRQGEQDSLKARLGVVAAGNGNDGSGEELP